MSKGRETGQVRSGQGLASSSGGQVQIDLEGRDPSEVASRRRLDVFSAKRKWTFPVKAKNAMSFCIVWNGYYEDGDGADCLQICLNRWTLLSRNWIPICDFFSLSRSYDRLMKAWDKWQPDSPSMSTENRSAAPAAAQGRRKKLIRSPGFFAGRPIARSPSLGKDRTRFFNHGEGQSHTSPSRYSSSRSTRLVSGNNVSIWQSLFTRSTLESGMIGLLRSRSISLASEAWDDRDCCRSMRACNDRRFGDWTFYRSAVHRAVRWTVCTRLNCEAS